MKEVLLFFLMIIMTLSNLPKGIEDLNPGNVINLYD